ncbi:hypothetical protein M4R22_05040 [Acidovorax sp. GBBC 3334]|uniref:hypothetical protein n=1 Tax=unclassified Acidovorax TaxID=2684926 RepID=UPI002302C5F0|nr:MULTISPECIES: hypothetical protein [unclassified Acidovorax]MDA8454121.1 hypothetical protein [Acidovorax sp. GBBC 3334]MDA8519992.1 hypothetical protein [Acidovorax sp. NCPPB 4044]
MKRWIALAIAVMVSGSLQAADKEAGAVQITNPELLSALQNPKAAQTAERSPLAFENGSSAKNCAEYSDLLAKSQLVESTRNFEIRSEYLLCDSIRLVADKPFVAGKASTAGRLAKTLYDKLDLRSFPSSLRNRADDKQHTLKRLLPGTAQSKGNAVQVETPDQFFRLEVVGIIDQGKGKKQDLIVWVTDELKNGTYRGYNNIVVHPPRSSAGLYTVSASPR